MRVKVNRINKENELPKYQSSGAAAVDLYANADKILEPNEIFPIPTGLRFEIPEGYEIQIRQRGGLASKGVIIPNSPGTVDADFRGEVFVLLMNLSGREFEIKKGDRIAQAVLNKYEKIEWVEVDELNDTDRGTGALGSTGV